MVDTPVLFATFARPEYANQTFNAIKKAKPKTLYFYSNKARAENLDEIDRNNQVRSLVDKVDWDCDLKIFFRDEYVDVYTSLWSAFDWVFENEEQAIILEEDCVPSGAFFDYCDQLILKFKNDQRVWLISGNNFFETYNPSGYDYIFTRFPFRWGWASWRSRWQKIERQNIPWEEIKRYELHRQLYSLSKRQTDFLIKSEEKIFKFIQDKPSWDFCFGFSFMKEGGFGIIPSENLINNIGLLGEHSKNGNSIVHNTKTLTSEIYVLKNEPLFVVPDYKYDQYFFRHMFYKKSLIHVRIWKKLIRILKTLKLDFHN